MKHKSKGWPLIHGPVLKFMQGANSDDGLSSSVLARSQVWADFPLHGGPVNNNFSLVRHPAPSPTGELKVKDQILEESRAICLNAKYFLPESQTYESSPEFLPLRIVPVRFVQRSQETKRT